ncbi:epoxide hydrolase family protein [Haematomicrobium sanguinis]|uniref:epoxide hydrolase family protein n=1 Tax=Haematomicrobium sanguinis TaxID=479106 RepID=UPI00054D938F|nr:epoxide hydrolase family protein [Haematomicrobium sanguinis]
MNSAITPFEVRLPDAVLEDVRSRLAGTKWPEVPETADWKYGVPLDYVKRLRDAWLNDFDWRAKEAKLNALPQFLTTIDDQPIHFIHVRSAEPSATPLLLTHGWPMSVFEYLDLIGPLTDPVAHGGSATDAYHVVLPSVPGIGFAGATTSEGWTTTRIAETLLELMTRLGYERFGAHGNDLGSDVSIALGRIAPHRVIGAHVTQVFSFPGGDPAEFHDLSTEDQAAVEFLQGFTSGGGLAFNAYQSAQPQTLSFALQDSPTGWLAWTAQLFRDEVPDDYVITNAATYWLTGTVASSVRRYFDDAHAEPTTPGPTTVPLGVAIFPNDFQSVRRFADRDHANIQRWTRMDKGGHFAAQQAPDLLLKDLWQFFANLPRP